MDSHPFARTQEVGGAVATIEMVPSLEWIDIPGSSSDPTRHVCDLLGCAETVRLTELAVVTRLEVEFHHGTSGYQDVLVKALCGADRRDLASVVFDAWMLKVPLELGALLSTNNLEYGGKGYTANIVFGDMGNLWKAAPNLKRLVISQCSELRLGQVAAPLLEELILGFVDTPRESLEPLQHATVPRLRRLQFRAWGADDIVRALVCNPGMGPLEHLGVLHLESGKDVVKALGESRHAPSLVTLDMRGAHDERDAVLELLSSRQRFPGLRSIILDNKLKGQVPSDKNTLGTTKLQFVARAARTHKDIG